jgi:hypothetical protein
MTITINSREQWAKMDPEHIANDRSPAEIEVLIKVAQFDLETLFCELEQYHDRYGPLDDEPPNPYKHAKTPFADNH